MVQQARRVVFQDRLTQTRLTMARRSRAETLQPWSVAGDQTPKPKHRRKRFYNSSLMIFDGWQDMDESAIKETLKEDEKIKITKSKYSCFSASYIEDLEKIFKHPVMIYKDYKKGVNGKLYA